MVTLDRVSRIKVLGAVGVIAAVLTGFLPRATAYHDHSYPGDARYSVPKRRMDRALDCRRGKDDLDGKERGQPVLLVHGTGVSRRQTWAWNYWGRLHDIGFEVCWVALPRAALGDIQVASEYVARAVQVMHRKTDEGIDVLGHSQGGLEPRWAIKWFPAGRRVGDYISLASPNHGTQQANHLVTLQRCAPACWQMRRGSNFIQALNSGDETPGAKAYTNVYSQTDELVQPAGTSALRGASNVLIQDICPGRPVEHLDILADFITYRLVMDALRHRGPARVRRAIRNRTEMCRRREMPGTSAPPFSSFPNYDEDEDSFSDREPRLARYARNH